MLVDIEKVIVGNRIRKDFGNIEELADDIKENGLINPPVVNTEYHLLAGERRLRACKLLGWKQIEVRMMDTRDAEHELNVEISENENRKAFSKAERVDYMKRLLAIEEVKAKERQNLGEKSHEGGRSDEITAEQFGVSSNTLRKEISIVDHADLLTPEDFADWDEGRLSTNRAYLKIKEELEASKLRVVQLEAIKTKDEDEIRELKEKRRVDKEKLEKEKGKTSGLQSEIAGLKAELEDAIALAFEKPEAEKSPIDKLVEIIGKTEMDALITASRSGKIIVVENDMGGSVAELAAMMGIRIYEKGDIFTLTLSDE